MLDLELARLADGRDRSPDGVELGIWSRVEALESFRAFLRVATKVQLAALGAALAISLGFGVSIAGGSAFVAPARQISTSAADLAPSTLLGSVLR